MLISVECGNTLLSSIPINIWQSGFMESEKEYGRGISLYTGFRHTSCSTYTYTYILQYVLEQMEGLMRG